ncbi:hypothetical protein N7462_000441 [Penicillium macrosclerotiorum]|uniref:uncharacterized protein n=1 Tax=Penicillium macrosclerotiorum TaxID=303699 RepID=UPI00254905FF|nr:uncharacterized protein N7462_000441 [Penicillium macrosclerotiorum]KAJ5698436.1 hypothetical protein N7462_000441 [Penicillium macrosclerotiorum]
MGPSKKKTRAPSSSGTDQQAALQSFEPLMGPGYPAGPYYQFNEPHPASIAELGDQGYRSELSSDTPYYANPFRAHMPPLSGHPRVQELCATQCYSPPTGYPTGGPFSQQHYGHPGSYASFEPLPVAPLEQPYLRSWPPPVRFGSDHATGAVPPTISSPYTSYIEERGDSGFYDAFSYTTPRQQFESNDPSPKPHEYYGNELQVHETSTEGIITRGSRPGRVTSKYYNDYRTPNPWLDPPPAPISNAVRSLSDFLPRPPVPSTLDNFAPESIRNTTHRRNTISPRVRPGIDPIINQARTLSDQPSDKKPALETQPTSTIKDTTTDGIPQGARWTKISRRLVNSAALREGKERFEERDDYFIVLRVLTKEEIREYADKTAKIRGRLPS